MYPSDLSDSQWAKLEPLLHQPREDRHGGGRPRKYALRRVTDALFYVVKTGCQWRQLPVDFPPWQTVYQQFRTWRMRGTWERVTKALRGTRPPRAGSKRHAQRGDCRFAVGQDGTKRGRRGYDAGKKIKGRKRHIAVDTQGNL